MYPTVNSYPYFERLRSDGALTTAGLQQAKQLVSWLQGKNSAIEKEITAALNVVDTVLEQHNDIQRQLDQWRALISPFKRVPPELLRIIFLHCLPEEGNAAMSSEEAPLLLGRVCSSWRKVAWSTPELWASVHIVVPDLDDIPPNHTDSVLDSYEVNLANWLSRSRNRALSISMIDNSILSIEGTENYLQEQLSAHVLSMITAHSSRWKDVRLKLPIEIISWYLHPANLPLLETLTIQVTNHGGDRSPETPSGDIAHPILETPSLRRISLADLSLVSGGPIPANWSHLTKLSLGGPTGYPSNRMVTAQTALVFLTFCRRLEACALHLSGSNGQHLNSEVVKLPWLVSFSVTVEDDPGSTATSSREHSLTAFFNTIRTPQLQSFAYTSSTSKASLPFVQLLQRSDRLKALKLFIGTSPSVQLSQILAMCTQVTELHLSSVSSRQILPVLNCVLSNGQAICPRLEILRLDCDSPLGANGSGDNPASQDHPQRSERYLRKLAEKARVKDCLDRTEFLWGRLRPKPGGKDGPLIGQLRLIELRLHQTYREDWLEGLAPLLEEGLQVKFQEY